jgi:predicted anti-sigma-YlaC factor YlaD
MDGHLSSKEMKAVRSHLEQCGECREEYRVQQRAQSLLKHVPLERCPEAVAENVLRHIDTSHRKEPRFAEKLSDLFHMNDRWLNAAVAVATIILLMFLVFPQFQGVEEGDAEYSSEEVAQAREDIELALGYLNYYAMKTEKLFEDHVISESFAKPLKSTMKIALKPISDGGDK